MRRSTLGRGAASRRVTPMLAATTSAIATISRAPRSWPRTRKPASAATAGSRLMSTPKTLRRHPPQRLGLQRVGDHRRSSSATPRPSASSSGVEQVGSGLARARDRAARARRRPSRAPGPRRRGRRWPARCARRMYERPARRRRSSANATPTRVERRRPTRVGEQHDAARGEQRPTRRSRRRRDEQTRDARSAR